MDGGFFAVKPSGRGEDGGGEDEGMEEGKGLLRKMVQCMYPLKHTPPVLWKTTLSFLYFGFWEDLKYELSFILPFYMCDTWITFLFVGGFMFGICSLDFSWGGECG